MEKRLRSLSMLMGLMIAGSLFLFQNEVFSAPSELPRVINGKPKACNFTNLSASADGQRVLVYKKHSRFLDYSFNEIGATAVLVGLKNLSNVEFRTLRSNSSIAPIGWSKDKVLLRFGPQNFLYLLPNSDFESASIDLPDRLSSKYIDGRHFSYSQEGLLQTSLQSLAELVPNEKELTKGTVFLTPQGVILADASSAQAFKVDFYGAQISLNEELYAPFWISPTVHHEYDRTVVDGLGFYDNKIPYSLPIKDINSGRKVGAFSLRNANSLSVVQEKSHDSKESDNFSKLTQFVAAKLPGYQFKDIIVAQKGIFGLIKSEMGLHLLKSNGSQHAIIDICSNSNPARKTPLKSEHESRFSAERLDNGVLLNKFSTRSDEDRAIVYFHGGPASSAYPAEMKKIAEELSFFEGDLFIPEYSGSVGAGIAVSNRLRRLGMDALKEDMEKLGNFLSVNGYKSVTILSTSFGAVPALLLQKEVPNLVEKSIFIAPYLVQRSISENASGNAIGEGASLAGQRGFEYAVFGGINKRSEFGRRLSILRDEKIGRRKQYFVFGSRDNISSVYDISGALPGQTLVIPNATHQWILTKRETWTFVKAVI